MFLWTVLRWTTSVEHFWSGPRARLCCLRGVRFFLPVPQVCERYQRLVGVQCDVRRTHVACCALLYLLCYRVSLLAGGCCHPEVISSFAHDLGRMYSAKHTCPEQGCSRQCVRCVMSRSLMCGVGSIQLVLLEITWRRKCRSLLWTEATAGASLHCSSIPQSCRLYTIPFKLRDGEVEVTQRSDRLFMDWRRRNMVQHPSNLRPNMSLGTSFRELPNDTPPRNWHRSRALVRSQKQNVPSTPFTTWKSGRSQGVRGDACRMICRPCHSYVCGDLPGLWWTSWDLEGWGRHMSQATTRGTSHTDTSVKPLVETEVLVGTVQKTRSNFPRHLLHHIKMIHTSFWQDGHRSILRAFGLNPPHPWKTRRKHHITLHHTSRPILASFFFFFWWVIISVFSAVNVFWVTSHFRMLSKFYCVSHGSNLCIIDVWNFSFFALSHEPEIWETHHNHIFMGAGKYENKHGVGIMLNRRWRKRIVDTDYINERAIKTMILVNRRRIDLMSVYFPHSKYADHHIEKMYKTIENHMPNNKKCIPIIGGDFNAELGPGKGSECKSVGKHTLNESNKRGDWLKSWLMLNDYSALNTMFRKTPQKQTSFVSPKGKEKQIDYILTKRRYLRNVKDAEANDMIHMGSDHRCVMATLLINIPERKNNARRGTAQHATTVYAEHEDEAKKTTVKSLNSKKDMRKLSSQ